MVQDLASPQLDSTLWEEELWDELLAYIEEQRVIPIIGPDLMRVEIEGSEVLLDRYLASQLAAKFSLPLNLLPAQPSLDQVVWQLLARKRRREALYPAIRSIMLAASFQPPKALRQLAEISDFNLFLTMTFDSLLEEAINTVRFGGRAEAATIAYSPNNFKDLDCAKESLNRPTVYHLLGKLSTSPSYVICEEDLLEWVCALQTDTDQKRPEKLFDELEKNHLLILGLNFSDWLARFFLRAAKRHRLSDQRDVLEILADTRTHHDSNLVLFLAHFSSRTRVFQGGGAAEFVDQLWQRWRQRNPEPAARKPIIPPARDMPAKAVFISYARQDLSAVQELKAGLDAAGLPVWFDQSSLEAGDSWEHKIKTNINSCCCFVAVLSQNTEAREEAVFRREWTYALDRDMNIDPGKPFIIPVVVDDTRQFSRVPDRLLQKHLTWLSGGGVTPEFIKKMLDIVRRS
jgi:TIR domain/SIR2-like domain